MLDADWVIDALAKNRRANETLKQLGSAGIGISVVTIGELYEGPFGTPRPDQNLASLREFLSLFIALDVTDPIMERFARIRHRLRRDGNLIPDFDLVIAATALELDLTVITFNVRHFERIPDLRLYPTR
ncbi:MAG: type II toxin-antitoxin system VapC family toxin [Chloroflexota bacterium]